MGSAMASSGMSVESFLAMDALGRTMTPAKTGPAKSMEARHSKSDSIEKET